jgi:RND family efflux transporter MFP subunit
MILVGVGAIGAVATNAVGTSRSEPVAAPPAAVVRRGTEPVDADRAPDASASLRDVMATLDPDSRSADTAHASPRGETFDCLVEPYYVVDIGSPVTGVIESIAVERGDSIEAGQVLVQLESNVERVAVEVARGRADMNALIQSHQARVALGEQRKTRADRLLAGDALSQDRSEEAETEAIIARLELEQAREKMKLASLELEHASALLARRSIRSPVSGVVVERMMAPGEVVDDETVLRVAQIDPLRVQIVLPGALFGSFRVGEHARIELELPGAEPRDARVVLVDRLIDAASGTFGIQLELPNPDESIPGGVHCQARFDRE